MKEQVLVFPATLLNAIGKFQGACTDVKKYLPHILNPEHLQYKERDAMETDPSYKQLIPYSVLRDKGKVFVYQRTTKGGESRLHGKYSCGVGGHINPVDGEIGSDSLYNNAFLRELQEEVSLVGNYKNTIVGLIYDDSTLVGQVHFGVVHRITLDVDYKLQFKDDALTKGGFRDIVWLRNNRDKFESWSQFVIDKLL